MQNARFGFGSVFSQDFFQAQHAHDKKSMTNLLWELKAVTHIQTHLNKITLISSRCMHSILWKAENIKVNDLGFISKKSGLEKLTTSVI